MTTPEERKFSKLIEKRQKENMISRTNFKNPISSL